MGSSDDRCVPADTLQRFAGDRYFEEELAGLARAVSHPARVRILRFLAAQEGCIGGDIVEELELAQSTVSEHLRVLKEAGLIQGEIQRPRVCYRLDQAGLARLKELIHRL